MSNDLNHSYETLGLTPGASQQDVKDAFRDLAKIWHPDRFVHDPRLQRKAEEKLKEITEAYQRLRNVDPQNSGPRTSEPTQPSSKPSETTQDRRHEQNRLKLARIALQNKNGEEALKYSNEVLEANPESAEAWMIKGTASSYVARGTDLELRYKEAMSCLDRAKNLDPSLTEVESRREEVRKLLCNYLCGLGKLAWDEAVKISNIYAKAGLGGYSQVGDLPEQAVQYYERALAIDAMYRGALVSVIHIRKETGSVELAASHIERIRKLDPSYDPPSNRTEPPPSNRTDHQILSSVLTFLALLILFLAMSKGCR